MPGPPAIAFAAATPLLAVSTVLLILGGAGANTSPASAVCGGGGTGQTIANVSLDAEQMANAQTIVAVVAGRQLPVYAADIAIDAAYTESTLHNYTTQTDHDSEGLFQQRVSIYTAAVATDPVKATDAFLERLVGVADWQDTPIGIDAQTVQISQYPDRYQPNAALAEQLVGQLWPAAAAAAGPPPGAPATDDSATRSVSDTTLPAFAAAPAICAGAGGAVATGGTVAGIIVGPTGNNIAGTTTIPAGLTLSGSPQGNTAVEFGLQQLGKPYVFAAAGPNAYDCSGLTMAAWAAAGVALPHLAAGQVAFGTPEPTDLSQAVSGDLVMIPGADGTAAEPGHVGMVAGYLDEAAGRHLLILQAPETGVPVILTEATEWSGQIVDVRHIA
jgi:cell wall-associated NlpC family hydrolase